MKQALALSIISLLALAACKKSADFLYRGEKQSVYFDLNANDSVVYTFAYEPDLPKDTLYLPVRLAGLRADTVRQFSVRVIDTGTTAKPGQHYEPFKSSYTFGADTGMFYLPVILYNTDPALLQRSVRLTLQLLPGAGLDTAVNKLIKAKVVLSNKLEKPSWWDSWPLGAYTQTRHQLFMIATGVTTMTTDGLDAPRNLYLAGRLNVMIADPFRWVSDNPDKGYVLTQRPDGHYDFYSTANPAQTILVRKNTSTGRWHFVDENGLDLN